MNEMQSSMEAGEDDQTMIADGDKLPSNVSQPGKPMKHHNVEELENEVIAGRYLIKKRVGKGGMGVVYLAEQTNLGREVCVKVLNPALIDDESAVVHFEREARGLSRLQHPNIVTIFDYGRDDDLAYIVMEYAQGETLSRYLKRQGPLDRDTFLPIAVQTLRGIGEAHKLGLIHRDIKPANIILCELEGEKNYVKILDFGLAKLAQGQEDVTKEQQLVGSASYMAPEQILKGTSDPRTDVYALGIMFYQMLAGKKPFTGPNDSVVLYKHVNEQAEPLSKQLKPEQGVPDTLCQVIEQAMNKDPDKRPETALAFLDAISYALDAPQLRAGFSSMSLGKVDLQRLTEDAETHAISRESRQLAAIPRDTADQGGSISQPSGVSHPSGVSQPSHPSGVSQPSVVSQPQLGGQGYLTDPSMSGVSSVSAIQVLQSGTLVQAADVIDAMARQKSSSDRRFFIMLLIGLVIVAGSIIAIMWYLKAESREGDTPIVVQTEKPQANAAEYFEKIEAHIAENRWSQAEQLLDAFNSDPTRSHNLETENRIIELRNQIFCGNNNARADRLVEDRKLDEAKAIYEDVLSKDPNNAHAIEAINKIKEEYSKMGALTLSYEPAENITVFINDEKRGTAPTELMLEPGKYRVRVVAEGYQDWSKEVSIKAGDAKSIDVRLAKLEAAHDPKPAGTSSSNKSSSSGSSSGTLLNSKGGKGSSTSGTSKKPGLILKKK